MALTPEVWRVVPSYFEAGTVEAYTVREIAPGRYAQHRRTFPAAEWLAPDGSYYATRTLLTGPSVAG